MSRPTEECSCGCGERTEGPWAPGHDSKALWMLMELEFGVTSTKHLLARFGYERGRKNLHREYERWKERSEERAE